MQAGMFFMAVKGRVVSEKVAWYRVVLELTSRGGLISSSRLPEKIFRFLRS